MRRKIIEIDQEKCNGCGDCIPNCPEGALQVIDGKARVVSELSCDGLGACIGHCPLGAIKVVEREAEPYDEYKVMGNIVEAGEGTIKAHLKHLNDHKQAEYLKIAIEFLTELGINIPEYQKKQPEFSGCPGMKIMDFTDDAETQGDSPIADAGESQLRQWPVQLALLNPQAPYFENADLLVTADCVPFAFSNYHQKFLKNKIVVMFCPKLDEDINAYIEKLAAIFRDNNIKSITNVKMSVPCCSQTTGILQKAMELAGKNIPLNQYTISLKGELI